MSLSGSSGDRSLGAIFISFLFLGLPAFGYMIYQGITTTVFTVSFGIPNTPFNFHFGFTFLSLIVTAIGIMVGTLALVFVLSSVSATILGTGFKGLSDGLSKIIIQWTFTITLMSLFALICAIAMQPIPFSFGIFYSILFELIGLAGLVMRFVA